MPAKPGPVRQAVPFRGGQQALVADSVFYDDFGEAMEFRGSIPTIFNPISYCIAFRNGLPSDERFGQRVGRLVAHLGGFSNIREASPFPSALRRLES